jgi:regulator of replication initiation timing
VAGKVQEKCGRKIATKNSRKSVAEKCGRKMRKKKCRRKIAAGKVWQKNRAKKCADREIIVGKSRQQNATRRKRYGFHMCSVEFMNLVEGFPCKSVGCPLGSLGLVVELI